MKLKCIDAENQTTVLAAGDSIPALKEIACAHYTGDEVLIWRAEADKDNLADSGDGGFCSDKLSNGTYYCID